MNKNLSRRDCYHHRHTEKGITLIALIITIIVILILVAVTVRTVANSGLFDHAKNATNRWAEEQEKESNIGNGPIEIGGEKYNSLDEYISQIGSEGGKHPDQSADNKDIGIGTDGKPVNLDLWRYTLQDDQTYRLSALDGRSYEDKRGYIGPFTETGEIIGTVPEYIINAETGIMVPVTSMLYTFIGSSIVIAPEIPKTVKTIEYAFTRCENLKKVIIPDTITAIDWSTFEHCTNLTSINIPDSVTSIECQAFYDCTGLTSISIPNSVTSIDSYAFSNCKSLTSINIPDGVTSIEYNAFSNCKSLTSINIPNSVTSIGNYAFYGCSALTNINIKAPEGSIAGAPWSATNATITWDYQGE